MSERLFLGPKTKTIIVAGKLAATLPLARFVRDDGKPRTHVPRCPSHPGEPLSENAVCCDCIYGAVDGAENEGSCSSGRKGRAGQVAMDEGRDDGCGFARRPYYSFADWWQWTKEGMTGAGRGGACGRRLRISSGNGRRKG